MDNAQEKAAAMRLLEILDVAHKLAQGSKKLEIRKKCERHASEGWLMSETTTYRIVDAQ